MRNRQEMDTQVALNKTQLEILNLFSRDLDEKDLIEIKRMITRYLSEKANALANNIWDEKGWTNQDMEELSKKHLRTPYRK